MRGIVVATVLLASLVPAGVGWAGGHGECGDAYTPIYDIQGDGPSSPLVNQVVVTEGVVTVDLQLSAQLQGFFVQDPVGDGDPSTSDGVFVQHQSTWSPGFNVDVGDHVRIRTTVREIFGQTELRSLSHGTVCGEDSVKSTKLDVTDFNASAESYEGMLVTFPRRLAVTDTFNLHRFGEVWLGQGEVVEQPTNEHPVGADASELAAENMAGSVLLDDGSRFSNPSPIPYVLESGTLRLGDTVNGLTGAVGFGFSEYRIQPQTPGAVDFRENNRRPAVPNVGGKVVVGVANVLNYWTTLGGRGASNAVQFEVQTEKLVAQILAMDADVVGLVEIENDADHTPILTLVEALNDALGEEVWMWVGELDYYNTYPIRNEIIYRSDRVVAVGDPVTIADPAFDTIPPGRTDPVGRPPVAQTFEADGEVFTVVVNHFKSKGCAGAAGLDLDQGDGQSCFNATRVAQAERILDMVTDLATETGDPDVLVLGDINAYLDEDPILSLETELVNLVRKYDHDPYSFNFFARFAAPWIGRGLLDYALATPSMSSQITRAAIWHINADEPRFLDWFNPATSADGPYRASDHDPILVGLELHP